MDWVCPGISQVSVFLSPHPILIATWNRISVAEAKLGSGIWLKIIWLGACCWGKKLQILSIFLEPNAKLSVLSITESGLPFKMMPDQMPGMFWFWLQIHKKQEAESQLYVTLHDFQNKCLLLFNHLPFWFSLHFTIFKVTTCKRSTLYVYMLSSQKLLKVLQILQCKLYGARERNLKYSFPKLSYFGICIF